MSVASGDIVIYGAASIAEDDASAQGGAINTAVRYIFDDASLANTLNDTLNLSSTRSEDTSQTVTITGRNSAGVIVSENYSVNGLSVITGSTEFERILKVVSDANHNGSIRVSGTNGTLLGTLESGVNTLRRPFYNASADVAGGSTKTYYEKVFIKNNNTVNAYLSMSVSDGGGDTNGYIAYALEDAVNDTTSVANRQTAPGASDVGASGFTALPVSMANQLDNAEANLLPGSGLGVWLRMTLPAGAAANKDTFTLSTYGQTT